MRKYYQVYWENCRSVRRHRHERRRRSKARPLNPAATRTIALGSGTCVKVWSIVEMLEKAGTVAVRLTFLLMVRSGCGGTIAKLADDTVDVCVAKTLICP